MASSPITAHALNATAVVRALTDAQVRVVWYLPGALAGHARRTGALPVPVEEVLAALPGEGAPGGAGASLAAVRRLYRDALVAPVAAHAERLDALVDEHAARLVVSDTLMLAAGLVAERRGLAWATIGDGPLAWPHPQVPPFGTGLPVLGGPAGRHRNRTVKRAVDALLFREALVGLNRVRADHGLWPVADLLTAGTSRQVHLQGCVPSFEHPRPSWPSGVHFVGALGPGPGLAPPLPDALRRGSRDGRLALVTQGTRRPDASELVDPAVDVLLDEGYRVVVAGARPARDDHRVHVLPKVDYADALAEADLFVTNGGWTGVTLALAAGTPVVQCGATEEKADIGQRLRSCGAGESIPLIRPPRWVLRRAIRRVQRLDRRLAQRRIAAEFAAHDTDALLGSHLLGMLDGSRDG